MMGIIEKMKKEMEKILKIKLCTIAMDRGVNLIPVIKNIFDNIDPHLTPLDNWIIITFISSINVLSNGG